MEKQLSQPMKILPAVMVIFGWFALVAQFYINASLKLNPVPEMITRYFSYFTIQINLVVALCYTVLLFSPGSGPGKFFSRQQTVAALTVYIVIVGLIYNIILRSLWSPEGLQKIVDEILHSLVPVLVLICWLVFAAKNKLEWKQILTWLIYPFAYIIYILLRGSVSGFYPYPFINTTELGLNKVLVNSAGIAVVFALVSFIFVAIGKSLAKKTQ